MTSEPPEGSRPPSNRSSRRVDEGDLWADDAPSGGSDGGATGPRATPAPRRPTPPRSQAAARPAPAPRQRPLPQEELPPTLLYDEDDDDEAYYEEMEPSPLSNPYLLAGFAIGGAVILAILVVFFFGRGGDSGNPVASTGTGATRTATPSASTTPGAEGLAARSIAIATVREGPALSHLELGSLQANQDVQVVGRNEDASWLLIVFPPGTQLRGWVPNSALRLPDNIEALVPVAEATPVPKPDVPEPTATPIPPEPTATPEAEGSPTPGPKTGPDIAIAITSDCTAGTPMVLNITNDGDEKLTAEPIQVTISSNGVVKYQQEFNADIDPGASATLSSSGVVATAPSMAVTVVMTKREDVDLSNNIASCAVTGGGGNVPLPIATQSGQ